MSGERRRKMRSAWREPGVLINKGHWDTSYFDATTEAAFHKSALSILAENLEVGFYAVDDDPIPEPSLSVKDALSVLRPGTPLRLAWETEKADFERAVKERREAEEFLADVEKAIAEKDGEAAWGLLESRRECESENVTYHYFAE